METNVEKSLVSDLGIATYPFHHDLFVHIHTDCLWSSISASDKCVYTGQKLIKHRFMVWIDDEWTFVLASSNPHNDTTNAVEPGILFLNLKETTNARGHRGRRRECLSFDKPQSSQPRTPQPPFPDLFLHRDRWAQNFFSAVCLFHLLRFLVCSQLGIEAVVYSRNATPSCSPQKRPLFDGIQTGTLATTKGLKEVYMYERVRCACLVRWRMVLLACRSTTLRTNGRGIVCANCMYTTCTRIRMTQTLSPPRCVNYYLCLKL